MQLDIAKDQLSKTEHSIANNVRRDKLIVDNLPLVKYVVGKVMIWLPSQVDQEDLIESGVLGLIEAAEKFDENKHVKFRTYAYHRIRGAILDYIRLQDWVPRSVREKESLIKKTYNALEQKLCRIPHPEEIAEELNIECSELDKILAEINLCSLLHIEDINYRRGDDSGTNVDEILKDKHATEPIAVLESEEEQKSLQQAIKELHPKERLVVTLYY